MKNFQLKKNRQAEIFSFLLINEKLILDFFCVNKFCRSKEILLCNNLNIKSSVQINALISKLTDQFDGSRLLADDMALIDPVKVMLA